MQLEDDGATVNVTSLVRFQPEHDDIRHGVSLSREGCSMLPAAFFPLDAVTQRSEPVIPGWTDNFSFPSALLKLTVTHEGNTIHLFHQHCICHQ